MDRSEGGTPRLSGTDLRQIGALLDPIRDPPHENAFIHAPAIICIATARRQPQVAQIGSWQSELTQNAVNLSEAPIEVARG